MLAQFLSAAEYLAFTTAASNDHAFVWERLLARDFPGADYARVKEEAEAHAGVVSYAPSVFYQICLGHKRCLICGEALFCRGDEATLLLLCDCLRLPVELGYPYAHAVCAPSQPSSPVQYLRRFKCRFCRRVRNAVPLCISSF